MTTGNGNGNGWAIPQTSGEVELYEFGRYTMRCTAVELEPNPFFDAGNTEQRQYENRVKLEWRFLDGDYAGKAFHEWMNPVFSPRANLYIRAAGANGIQAFPPDQQFTPDLLLNKTCKVELIVYTKTMGKNAGQEANQIGRLKPAGDDAAKMATPAAPADDLPGYIHEAGMAEQDIPF